MGEQSTKGKQLVSPESIERLIKQSKTMGLASEKLLDDIEYAKTTLDTGSSNNSQLLKFMQFVYELVSGSILGMNETFMGLRDLLQADSLYEKRYHMQMINLCQVEWCKYLKGTDGNGVLTRLTNFFKDYINDGDRGFAYLSDLQQKVKVLGGKCDLALRNMTAHYDKPFEMYNRLSVLNDEDEYAQRVGMQMEIHDKILEFSNAIFAVVYSKKTPMSSSTLSNKSSYVDVRTLINNRISETFNENVDLRAILQKQLLKAWNEVESMRKLFSLCDSMMSFLPQCNQGAISIQSLQTLVEMRWVVLFMRSDLECAMNSYLNASSHHERSICLHRIYGLETAALTHLYGYNDVTRERSIWHKLEIYPEFIADSTSNKIEEQLKILTAQMDCTRRNLHSHYREYAQLNVSKRWQEDKNLDHIAELMRIYRLRKLCTDLDRYVEFMLFQVQKSIYQKKCEYLGALLKIRELCLKWNKRELVNSTDKLISLLFISNIGPKKNR